MMRFIATDMDGTLVNHEGTIDDKVFEMIKYLNEREIIFAAASGRFYSQLCKNFEKVESEMLFIAHNGALIKYNNDGETLFSSTISSEMIEHVVNADLDFGQHIFLAGEKNAYLVNPHERFLEGFASFDVPAIVVNSYDEVKEPIYKITYFMVDGISEEMKAAVDDMLPNSLESILSGKHWLDIMNKDVSKGNAIEFLQKTWGFTPEETMVFGDYYNDLSMFKVSNHSYAMKDAPEDVKRMARYVAGSNTENAVYKSIDKYLKSV